MPRHQLTSLAGHSMHVYKIRPRKDHCGVDLISDALPFGRSWYDTLDHAIGYAMHSSRSHDAVIRVYDEADNVVETHGQAGRAFQRALNFLLTFRDLY